MKINLLFFLLLVTNFAFTEENALESEKVDSATLQKEALHNLRLGDTFFAQKSYEAALHYYKEALELCPDNEYIIDKIAKAQQTFDQARSKSPVYLEYIQSADEQFQLKNYSRAESLYQQALGYAPNDQLMIKKLNETKGLLELQAEEELQYTKLIAAADRYFESKDYTRAKEYFNRAKTLKSSDPYPKSKVAEIEELFAATDSLKVSKKVYADQIVKADKLFLNQSYAEAKEAYQEASNVIPAECYPKDQISRIEQILLENLQLTLNYENAIANGDWYYKNKQFEKAKEHYEKAIAIDPKKPYPAAKLSEVNALLEYRKKD